MLHISTLGQAPAAGSAAQVPTIMQLLQRALDVQAQRELMTGLRGAFRSALGAVNTDWNAFYTRAQSSYQNAANDPTPTTPAGMVYCLRGRTNSIECALTQFRTAPRKSPIVEMQRAADRILNIVYGNPELVNRTWRGIVPDGKGGTVVTEFKAGSSYSTDYIRNATSGYDGVVGPGTFGGVMGALLLAGMLKSVPEGVNFAFAKTRTDYQALWAADIAAYLNDVADNFAALLSAYNERGPASTPLEPLTITADVTPPSITPTIKPTQTARRNTGALIGIAAAGVLLTVGASLAARKAQQERGEDSTDDLIQPTVTMGARRARAHRRHRIYRGDW